MVGGSVMKKLFMFLLILLVGISLYSEEKIKEAKEDDENFSYYLTVDQLINKSLFKNKDLIFEYSQKLNNDQILLLQRKHQKDLVIPLLLNGFIGFGSGNFACGDMVGGGIHMGIDMIATITAFSALIYNLEIIFDVSTYTRENFNIRWEKLTIAYSIYITAGIVMLVNRIASDFTAGLYVINYNKTLNSVLIKKTDKVSFTPMPIISPKGMGLALNIRF